MAFNQNSFLGFTNNQIIEFINDINNQLNENIPISRERGSHRRNIRTLINYLNQHNAQEIINPEFNDDEFEEGLDKFIIHEQERLQYEQNYLDSINNESIHENELNETYTQYFNKQHELNKSYEQNYNENILNRESFYDDELDEENIQYFERQAEIENLMMQFN
ncbi:hypothetical protein M9Y10_014209 [Tritrichomonas musculus]|uniref:Uncharacterized protein n=1 Tax=Tritrichomonas musculus TaxID=1915356 RepID=A0ABR2L024_9EUKA